MDEDATRIGPRLRSERTRSGLSHARLAQLTGLSKTYLVRLETDPASNPSLEVLHRIADALDLTVADLVGARVQFEPDDAPIPPSLRAFAEGRGAADPRAMAIHPRFAARKPTAR